MKTSMEEVLGAITKELNKQVKGISIIVFGSVARSEETDSSDIDLCVICRQSQKKTIASKLMDIEKIYDKSIQVVFTDKAFTGMDHTFVETILREGKILIGRYPDVTLNRLRLDPYRLIRYEIRDLSKREKMRLRRLLYGIETKKRYKDKVYVNRKRGLVDVTGGLRTGIASVIVPEKEARKIEGLLKENGALVQSYPVWMSKV
jgi:predicted nucleotidyltransferase